MTKEQYNSDNKFDYLSQEDKRDIEKINAKNKWGFEHRTEPTYLVNLHHASSEDTNGKRPDYIENGYDLMAKIEYRLTDMNYHKLCRMLEDGLYDETHEEVLLIGG